MKQGDIVVRRSYGEDIPFRIESIVGDIAILRGLEVRLLADAPLSDLVRKPLSGQDALSGWDDAAEQRTQQLQKDIEEQLRHIRGIDERTNEEDETFDLPGKVLHLDGDSNYLRKCMQVYARLRIPAEGHYVPESGMADLLYHILPKSRPDIVVITGHDGLYKNHTDKQQLSSYKNSHNFVRAVQTVRQYERNRDSLTVIAGACQSHFEALLQAGANFASSPARILIHALDPVHIAVKAAYTSIRDTVKVPEVLANIQSGVKGMGGYETRGSFRIGTPKIV
jgi:spore coat assembly protein